MMFMMWREMKTSCPGILSRGPRSMYWEPGPIVRGESCIVAEDARGGVCTRNPNARPPNNYDGTRARLQWIEMGRSGNRADFHGRRKGASRISSGARRALGWSVDGKFSH